MMLEVEPRMYKAFLSHEGSDKLGVVSFLRHELERCGMSREVFYDDNQPRGGTRHDTIKPQLRKALRGSEWFIALITPEYLSHYWCMWELIEFWLLMDQDSENNSSVASKKILPIFYGVSAKDCKNQDLLKKCFKNPGGPVSKGLIYEDLCEVVRKTVGILGIDAAKEYRRLTDAEVVHEALKTLFGVQVSVLAHHQCRQSLAMEVPKLAENVTKVTCSLIAILSALRNDTEVYEENRDLFETVSGHAKELQENIERVQDFYQNRRRHLSETVMQLVEDCLVAAVADTNTVVVCLSQLKDSHITDIRTKKAKLTLEGPGVRRNLENARNSLKEITRDVMDVLQVVNSVQPCESTSTVPPTSGEDGFVPSYVVPENDGPAVLDFSRNSGTPESSLKYLLLSDTGSVTLAAVGKAYASRGPTAMSAQGMGGVGKSFALRGLGLDEGIRAHFVGGVYYMTFGHDASKQTLISALVNIVREAGGRKRSKAMSNLDEIQAVQAEAAEWFRGRRCLFIADDIWHYDDAADGFVSILKALPDRSCESRLLISTRCRFISDCVNSEARVDFSPREWDGPVSRSVLCENAHFSTQVMSQNVSGRVMESFTGVLKRCSGLPLALAMAGRSVRKIAETCDDDDKMQAWILYYEETFQSDDTQSRFLTDNIPGFNNYPGLAHICEGGLKQLDRNDTLIGLQNSKPRELYYRLAVAEKQQWLSVQVLKRLWGMSNDEHAKVLAQLMTDLELCKISRQRHRDTLMTGISMHDLQHDFCEYMARKEHILENAHATLLDGYIPRGHGVQVRSWWCEELAHDEYIHKNLARHLISCGRPEELEGLLLDYRWTQRQMDVSGIGLVCDFELLEKEFEQKLTQNSTSELSNRLFALSRIRHIFHNSWTYVMKNKNELPTHMYGRLFFRRDGNQWIASYVDSLQKHTKIPWLRTLVRCIAIPSDDMIARWNVGDRVESVASVCDSPRLVVGGDDGMLRMMDCESGAELQRFEGHTYSVSCVAVSSDGQHVVAGSFDETIRVWDALSGDMKYTANMSHRVHSLALSGDGQKLVFGCNDGSVGVRCFPNIHEIVCDIGLREYAELNEYGFYMPKVAINGDGRFAASGTYDGIVRLWDGVTGFAIGSAMRGHAEEIKSIVMTRDGSRIVSSAHDGVFVWDAVQQVALAGPLECSKLAWSVSLSADESRIAVGHENGDISIYDGHAFRPARRRLRGHTGYVMSVAFCCNGSRLVSGSTDYTVRYWNCSDSVLQSTLNDATQDSHPTYQPRRRIAMSANCKIVALVTSCNIVLYNAESCERVGELSTIGPVSYNICLSDDGNYVGVIFDYSFVVWNIEYPASPRQVFEEKYTYLYRVGAVFSADSTKFAAHPPDDSIKVYDVSTGQCVQQITSNSHRRMTATELRTVAFPSDSSTAESSSSDTGSNDCPVYFDYDDFYARTASSNLKILSRQIRRWERDFWAFDRLRGRLWLNDFEGFLFIAQLENIPLFF